MWICRGCRSVLPSIRAFARPCLQLFIRLRFVLFLFTCATSLCFWLEDFCPSLLITVSGDVCGGVGNCGSGGSVVVVVIVCGVGGISVVGDASGVVLVVMSATW